MLGFVRRVLSRGEAVSAADACAGCDPEVLALCKAPEAGSVTPHDAHVFVKLAPPSVTSGPDEGWWSEKVDGEPALAAITAALAASKERLGGKKIKVTAFDTLPPAPLPPGAATSDALVFPAGIALRGLPLEQLAAAVVECLAAGAATPEAAAAGSQGGAAAAPEQLQGATLFVCCHARRDRRCGELGPPLAERLAALVQEQGLGDGVRVLKTSHIGGHVYAGNVLLYCTGSGEGAAMACSLSGDWFGGVHAGNAADFLAALLQAQAPSGAVGEPALRPWWRGRVGLSKPEQVARFEAGGLRDIEDLQPQAQQA